MRSSLHYRQVSDNPRPFGKFSIVEPSLLKEGSDSLVKTAARLEIKGGRFLKGPSHLLFHRFPGSINGWPRHKLPVNIVE